jgi:hypothetical protein
MDEWVAAELAYTKDQEVFYMTFMRSVRWLMLALAVFGAAAQQQARALQLPVGTTRTGTFIWDGERWIPAEAAPAPDVDAEEITVDVAPPPLPVYVQPPCPEPNLIWTPGYWHHGFLGYYWVPGAWVPAPYVGALWTPSYWGFAGGSFGFHKGYWGPHIGFYGGVNYGGGYMGIGFAGGSWNGGVFAYNTAVVNVNRSLVTNTYVNTTIVQQTTIVNTTNVSFNGGPNGVQHQPSADEQVAAHEQHMPPTTFQKQHVTAAAADKSNFASNNGGHPTHLAVAKPLAAEKHAAPAGFKPPPPRPVSELAKAQAPPATIEAAKRATAKTATVAKPAPTPAAQPLHTSAPAANSMKEPQHERSSVPPVAGKPANPPARKISPPAENKPPVPVTALKPETPSPSKPLTLPPGRPKGETAPKSSAPPPPARLVAPVAPKTVSLRPPAPKPAAKPVPKPAPASKPATKEKEKKV